MKLLAKGLASLSFLLLAACHSNDASNNQNGTDLDTPDWTETTHSNNVDPNYEMVFPQSSVPAIEITMTSQDWSNIQTNMQNLWGSAFGSGQNKPGGSFPSTEPDYVAVSLKSNGIEWYKVGFRFKGNSSLRQSWSSGIYKLPFRLSFDQYEDQYPAIKNQRFYGFKEFSLSPGAKDNSLMREKIGADIFRKAGIPAPQTAFYRVYIDFGSGKKYCGVYTLVEVVDDTMVKDQFGEDDGNIYKPESQLSVFNQSLMNKKNNETLNDYTDIQAFITALNSGTRNTDAALWRSNLESTFNVNHFIKWLAVNTAMTNWDTYGTMAHNYYFYNHSVNKLTWIPWDNNEALADHSGFGGGNVSLPLSSVTNAWPMIRYIADDAQYYAQYKIYVREFADNAFEATSITTLLDQYHNLIAPYIIGPEETESGKYSQLTSSAAFTSELATLKQYILNRHTAVDAFVP